LSLELSNSQYKLEDLCLQITDGKHGDCENQENSGYYFVSVKDIDEGEIHYSNARQITKYDFEDTDKRTRLENEDILITNSGTIGKFVFVNSPLSRKTTFQKSVAIIKPNKNKILPKFLYYYLISEKRRLIEYAGGTTQKNLLLRDIRNFEVEVPDEFHQKKIIEILNTIDELIKTKKKLNKNLEGLAKSIYRYHFIDFKPYSQDNFKSTTIGEIPENWSVQSIEDFVDDMKNGGTPKRGESDYWKNGTVPWLKTGEINNNIIIKSEEHITKLGLKNSSAKLLPVNSIIMALYGTGTAARIGLLKLEATTNQACCAMICNDFNKTLFLYLFLLFNQKEIENLASGSVQQNLSKDLIANLKLVVPPIEIIDNLPFKEIFDTIANNYFEIEYLTNLRDTLLPKLMSGEMDISKINCDLKIIIIKFILNPLKYLWRYLNENKDYIQNTKSNETLLKSRPIYKINKFFTKFTSRYRNYRQ